MITNNEFEIGDKIGTYTILDKEKSDNKKDRGIRVILKCECGNIINRKYSNIKTGQQPRCKCIANRLLNNDIYIGMIYHSMTVVSIDNNSGGNGKHFRWNLKCSCGQIHNISSWSIRHKHRPKCSCSRDFEDLTGFTINNIIVCGFAGYDNRHNRKKPQWFYQCVKCGIIKMYTGEVIKRGDIHTCNSKECRPQGKEHKKYKEDGVSRERRDDSRHKNWSRKVFERDGFQCVCCGGTKIQAHHLDGWNWCKEKRYDIENGVTLCKGRLSGCHYDFHTEYGRGDNTKEQFEEFLKKCYNKSLDEIIYKVGLPT